MGVGAEHEVRAIAGGALRLPGRVREKDGGARRPSRKRLCDRIGLSAGPGGGGEVLHTGQNEAGPDLHPPVAQHLDRGLIGEERNLVTPAVRLVVACDGPDAERRGKAAQPCEQVALAPHALR